MSPARPGAKSKAFSTQGPALDYPQHGRKIFSPQMRPNERSYQAVRSPGTATLLLNAVFDSPGDCLEQDRKIQCKIQFQCRTEKLRHPTTQSSPGLGKPRTVINPLQFQYFQYVKKY